MNALSRSSSPSCSRWATSSSPEAKSPRWSSSTRSSGSSRVCSATIESAIDESFGPDGGLEYPQYTRPRVYRDRAVPEVLLNGDHAAIARWRLEHRR